MKKLFSLIVIVLSLAFASAQELQQSPAVSDTMPSTHVSESTVPCSHIPIPAPGMHNSNERSSNTAVSVCE